MHDISTGDFTHDADRHSLCRKVLLIVPNPESLTGSKSEIQKRIRDIRQRIAKVSLIRDSLRKSIAEIERISGHLAPTYQIDVDSSFGTVSDLEIFLQQRYPRDKDRSYTRVLFCIHANSNKCEISQDVLDALKITHFVHLHYDMDVPLSGDSPDSRRIAGPVTSENIAHISCDLESFPHLVHDIILDLVLFHTFARPLKNSAGAGQSSFNMLKYEFARERELSPTYVDTTSVTTPSLITFTSCVRNPDLQSIAIDRSEAEQLVSTWRSFLDSLGIRPIPVTDPTSRILYDHILSEQLSPSQLNRLTQELPADEYLLVTSVKRPHEICDRQALARMFQRENWSRNITAVILADDFPKWAKFAGYCLFFTFRKY